MRKVYSVYLFISGIITVVSILVLLTISHYSWEFISESIGLFLFASVILPWISIAIPLIGDGGRPIIGIFVLVYICYAIETLSKVNQIDLGIVRNEHSFYLYLFSFGYALVSMIAYGIISYKLNKEFDREYAGGRTFSD